MISNESVPVGFRSFSQDVFAEVGGETKATCGPHEISFAKDIEFDNPSSPNHREEKVLQEINEI